MTDPHVPHVPPVRRAVQALRRLYTYDEILAELLDTAPDAAPAEAPEIAPPAPPVVAAPPAAPVAEAPEIAPPGVTQRILGLVRNLRTKIRTEWAVSLQARAGEAYPSGAEAVTECARLLLWRWPAPIGLADVQRALRTTDVEADELARHLDQILADASPPVEAARAITRGGGRAVSGHMYRVLAALVASRITPAADTREGRALAQVLEGWKAGQRANLIRPAARAQGLNPSALRRHILARAVAAGVNGGSSQAVAA